MTTTRVPDVNETSTKQESEHYPPSYFPSLLSFFFIPFSIWLLFLLMLPCLGFFCFGCFASFPSEEEAITTTKIKRKKDRGRQTNAPSPVTTTATPFRLCLPFLSLDSGREIGRHKCRR
jgi:hypothetical protein